MLIDTHAHLNFKAFDKDRNEVIKRCLDNDVWVINASSNYETSKFAIELAEKYQQSFFASVGLHPIHVGEEDFDAEKYRELAKSDKVVAIGETGLDFMKGDKEKQPSVFLQHLKLAKELTLPVILHCRKAHNEMIEILQGESGVRGVVHCFTGRWQQAKAYLDMGLYLGFNGIIFKFDVDDVIKKIPLSRLLIETDCPYLTPSQASTERNEPIYVKYVVERIAELRGESFKRIAEAAAQNAISLFLRKAIAL